MYFGVFKVTLADYPIGVEFASVLCQYGYDIREAKVLKLVNVPLTNNQLGALVSLTYNIGITNFRRSTLLRRLNEGDYTSCAEEFWKWRRGGGMILAGLVRRRKIEKQLFLSYER